MAVTRAPRRLAMHASPAVVAHARARLLVALAVLMAVGGARACLACEAAEARVARTLPVGARGEALRCRAALRAPRKIARGAREVGGALANAMVAHAVARAIVRADFKGAIGALVAIMARARAVDAGAVVGALERARLEGSVVGRGAGARALVLPSSARRVISRAGEGDASEARARFDPRRRRRRGGVVMGGAGVERREVDEREEIQVECLKTTTQLCFFHLGECSNTTKSAIVGKLGTPQGTWHSFARSGTRAPLDTPSARSTPRSETCRARTRTRGCAKTHERARARAPARRVSARESRRSKTARFVSSPSPAPAGRAPRRRARRTTNATDARPSRAHPLLTRA